MKALIIVMIALCAILSGCATAGSIDNPLFPPTPAPRPTAIPAPPAPTAAPALPAPPPTAPAAGQIVVDGIAFYHVGGDKYTPASGGCVNVPTGARLDTPQGPFYFGESVSFDTATLYTNSGPLTAVPNPRKLCVPSGAGAVSQQSQAQPAAAPAQPVAQASTTDPSKDIGGQWLHVSGNKYSLTGGSHTIHGAQGWTVHTPDFPGDPGLPVGKSETTSVATAYRK